MQRVTQILPEQRIITRCVRIIEGLRGVGLLYRLVLHDERRLAGDRLLVHMDLVHRVTRSEKQSKKTAAAS